MASSTKMASSVYNIVCPKCEIILRPPFTTCSGGHLLCKNCPQHIDAVTGTSVAPATCGGGQFPLPLLNKLLRDIMDECQYGCGHRADVVDLAGHEEACSLISKCAIQPCQWFGPIGKLVKHVVDAHPERLVDAFVVKHHFILNSTFPVLLLTHWERTSPNNVFYWLRLHKTGNLQIIMIQYAGQIGQEVDQKFMVKEYSVSPVNIPELSLNIKVVLTKSEEHDILKDKFVADQGAGVTVLNADKFLIKMNDVLSRTVIFEFLTFTLECFMCSKRIHATIRMCVNGHSFCDTCCESNNNKCTKCDKDINSFGRNDALEALRHRSLPNIGNTSKINELITMIPCKYRDSGCQFTDKYGIDGHVEVCEYQPSECEYRTEDNWCHWKGPHIYLIGHIVTEHGGAMRSVNATHLVPCTGGYYYYLYDNNYFDCTFGTDQVRVRHITTKTESNYVISISVTKGSKTIVTSEYCKAQGKWIRLGLDYGSFNTLFYVGQLQVMVHILRKPS